VIGYKTILDAIVTYLNGESFSQPFTAVRLNRVVRETEASSALGVFVFPIERTRTRDGRDKWRVDYTVGIAICKKITATTDAAALAEEDGLMALNDEIEDSISTQSDFGGAGLFPTFDAAGGTKAPFNDETMQKGIFITGILISLADIT
jgi:hypothetical protein